MLRSLESSGRTVIADLEAGLGTLTRLRGNPVDIVLVVVDATVKSLEVGRRAVDLVRAESLGRVIVVANRLAVGELDRVREIFPEEELAAIPDDPRILEADRAGVAPLDLHGPAPAVTALAALGQRLVSSELLLEQGS